MFVCSAINAFIIYLEGGIENPQKRMETRGKVSLKFHFTSGSMELKKDTNKAEMKERMKTTGHLLRIFADIR